MDTTITITKSFYRTQKLTVTKLKLCSDIAILKQHCFPLNNYYFGKDSRYHRKNSASGKDSHATTVTKLFAKTTIWFLLWLMVVVRSYSAAKSAPSPCTFKHHLYRLYSVLVVVLSCITSSYFCHISSFLST